MTLLAPIKFHAKIATITGYPALPETLGEHLLKKQIDLGISLSQAANSIGIHKKSLICWHRNRRKISERYYPQIMQFLGYCPIPYYPKTFGQLLRLYRSHAGYTRETLGKELHIGPTNILEIENGKTPCNSAYKALNIKFMDL